MYTYAIRVSNNPPLPGKITTKEQHDAWVTIWDGPARKRDINKAITRLKKAYIRVEVYRGEDLGKQIEVYDQRNGMDKRL